MSAKTLYEKLVESHTIRELDNEGHVLLYIDRSILNEYTSPQAFSGLRERGRTVRHPDTFLLIDWPPESPDNQYHLNK